MVRCGDCKNWVCFVDYYEDPDEDFEAGICKLTNDAVMSHQLCSEYTPFEIVVKSHEH